MKEMINFIPMERDQPIDFVIKVLQKAEKDGAAFVCFEPPGPDWPLIRLTAFKKLMSEEQKNALIDRLEKQLKKLKGAK